MNCPQCQQKYHCPCEACARNFPNDKPKWIVSNMKKHGNDWDESCPNCGFKQSVHWWFEEEFRQRESAREGEDAQEIVLEDIPEREAKVV